MPKRRETVPKKKKPHVEYIGVYETVGLRLELTVDGQLVTVDLDEEQMEEISLAIENAT